MSFDTRNVLGRAQNQPALSGFLHLLVFGSQFAPTVDIFFFCMIHTARRETPHALTCWRSGEDLLLMTVGAAVFSVIAYFVLKGRGCELSCRHPVPGINDPKEMMKK